MPDAEQYQKQFDEACAAIDAHSMAELMSAVPSDIFAHIIQQREAITDNSLLHLAALADFSGALRYLLLQCNHARSITTSASSSITSSTPVVAVAIVPSEIISHQNSEGKTALHIAMERGNITVITVLRDSAERLKVLESLCALVDVDGRTVLDAAATPDLEALVTIGIERQRAAHRQQITSSSTEPSPPAARNDIVTSSPRRPSIIRSSGDGTFSFTETRNNHDDHHTTAQKARSPSSQRRYDSAMSIDDVVPSPYSLQLVTTASPSSSSTIQPHQQQQFSGNNQEEAIQQILSLQRQMMSMLERLPVGTVVGAPTTLTGTHASPQVQPKVDTRNAEQRLLLQVGGSEDQQRTTLFDGLPDDANTAESISNRRLLHMLVLAGESSERHGVERDCLKSYLTISEKYHRDMRAARGVELHDALMGRRSSQATLSVSHPAPVKSTQQYRAESETGSNGHSSVSTTIQSFLPLPPQSTLTYASGTRSTSSTTRDAATCTTDLRRPPSLSPKDEEELDGKDPLNRSVLIVHGERHMAGQELGLLIQWRGEEVEDWVPLSEVADYAVVKAYMARKKGASSSAGYGSPISSAGGGFARMGSPLGETERDDLSNQLAALHRVSTGGGLDSAGGMQQVWDGGIIQWLPMQPPALETLFDRGRMEPSFVAIQAELLMAAIASAEIGNVSQSSPQTGFAPVAWNTSAPSSAGLGPVRSNVTPINSMHPQRRYHSGGNLVQTPLGLVRGGPMARHSSELKWGINNFGIGNIAQQRAASSPVSKRISRELPPRRNQQQVALPASDGLLPEEYQTTDLQDVDEVLPPPPQRWENRLYKNNNTDSTGALGSPHEDLSHIGPDDEDSVEEEEEGTTGATFTDQQEETETTLHHYAERMRSLEERHQAYRDRMAAAATTNTSSSHPSGIPRPPPQQPTTSHSQEVLLTGESEGLEAKDIDEVEGRQQYEVEGRQQYEVVPDEEVGSWHSLNSSDASDIRNMLDTDNDHNGEEGEHPAQKRGSGSSSQPRTFSTPPPLPPIKPPTTNNHHIMPIKYDQQFLFKGKPKRSRSPSPSSLGSPIKPTYPMEDVAPTDSNTDEAITSGPPLPDGTTGAAVISRTPSTTSPTVSARMKRANSEVPLSSKSSAAPPRASTALPPLAMGVSTPNPLPPALKGGNTERSTPGSAAGGFSGRQVRFEGHMVEREVDESKLPWIPKYGAPPPSRPSRLAPLD